MNVPRLSERLIAFASRAALILCDAVMLSSSSSVAYWNGITRGVLCQAPFEVYTQNHSQKVPFSRVFVIVKTDQETQQGHSL